MGNSIVLYKRHQRLSDLLLLQQNYKSTHFLGRFQGLQDPALHFCIDFDHRFVRRPNVNRIPLRVQLRG